MSSTMANSLLAEAVEAWGKQFADPDVQISGADLVEWFADWLARAKANAAPAAGVDANTGQSHYLVNWEIDIYADRPREAAEAARRIQLNRGSSAVVFQVLGGTGAIENVIENVIDLDDRPVEVAVKPLRLEGPI